MNVDEYAPSCPYVVQSKEVKLEDRALECSPGLVIREMIIKLKLAKR